MELWRTKDGEYKMKNKKLMMALLTLAVVTTAQTTDTTSNCGTVKTTEGYTYVLQLYGGQAGKLMAIGHNAPRGVQVATRLLMQPTWIAVQANLFGKWLNVPGLIVFGDGVEGRSSAQFGQQAYINGYWVLLTNPPVRP